MCHPSFAPLFTQLQGSPRWLKAKGTVNLEQADKQTYKMLLANTMLLSKKTSQ